MWWWAAVQAAGEVWTRGGWCGREVAGVECGREVADDGALRPCRAVFRQGDVADKFYVVVEGVVDCVVHDKVVRQFQHVSRGGGLCVCVCVCDGSKREVLNV